jgi:hypothetical protein
MKRLVIIVLLLIWSQPCFATYFIEGKTLGEKISLVEPNELNFGYQDFSFSIWVRTRGTASYILNCFGGYPNGSLLQLNFSSNGKPDCKISTDDPIDEVKVYSNTAIKDSVWHLITVTCDRDAGSGGFKIWTDGNSTGSANPWKVDGHYFAFGGNYYFNNILDMSTSINYLQVDQFRFYKGIVLTQTQIQTIYNNGMGVPTIESQMETLCPNGFYYLEFEEGIGNPVGRLWNGSTWVNSATTNIGCLWQVGGIPFLFNRMNYSSDCIINFHDFSFFALDWGKTEPNLQSDFDNSGTVEVNDLAIFCDYWLREATGAAPVVKDVNFSLYKNTSHSFDINAFDVESLVYTVESLPTKGTVYDGCNVQITSVPKVLPNKTIKYTAGDYSDVNDTFTFAADDNGILLPPCGGKTIATAYIHILTSYPSKATNPIPEYNAVSVALDINLSWTAGSSSTSHLVYLGTDMNAPTFQKEQEGNSFDPNNFLWNTTVYWWRIDEKNSYGTTTGDLWKFTTQNPPEKPIAYNLDVSVYTYVTTPITLLAIDDGQPNPPGRLNYIITSLPENAILQDPCSGAGIIDGNMLPYTLSGWGSIVWFVADTNILRTFNYQANDSNNLPDDGNSNTATVTITVLDHPRDLLSFDGLGIVEFNDSNYYDINNGWAIDFWVRTREPFTGLLNKRDANQGWEIGITSGKPKIYIYDNNAVVVAEARSFWRIDDGTWHEIAFNYNQDVNGIYLVVQNDGISDQFSFAGDYPSFQNDCNLKLGYNSKQGYRGDIDMLRFFSGITDPTGIGAIIQGLYNRDGTGNEQLGDVKLGDVIGIVSKIRYPMNEGAGLTITDDKLGYTGILQDPNHVRWYPFYWPFEDVSVQQNYRRNP